MITSEQIMERKAKVCVVGLGYVGLPLAVLLSKKLDVIGFDISQKRVAELGEGYDQTNEINSDVLANTSIQFTANPKKIRDARFIIIAVPTPITPTKTPDLSILEAATRTVAEHLQEGSVVVYESTVYPGVTEEICVPILEKNSGLVCGKGFSVGYSPERVNPGDKEHTIDKIVKVVSGSDDQTTELIATVYGSITNTFKAASIKVAEAAKAIENTQRDLNIALMNELAIFFGKIGISIYDVIEAAGTKWNFVNYQPGLVGGHCIGVDPYYLTYKAQSVGHNPEVILAGRSINDNMHKYVAHQIVKQLVRLGKDASTAKIVLFGFTFKENIPDVRNTKIAELYKELKDFGITPIIYDPYADPADVMCEYGIKLIERKDLPKADALVVAVAHDEFKAMTITDLKETVIEELPLLIDLKNIFNKEMVEDAGISYWKL